MFYKFIKSNFEANGCNGILIKLSILSYLWTILGIVDPWYGQASHYWSLNSVQEGRVKDLKGGKLSEVYSMETVDGYSKKGLRITNKAGSGIKLGNIKDACLNDPNSCNEGFTITFWIKLRTIKYSKSYHTIIQTSRRHFSVGTALLLKERDLNFFVNSLNRTRKLTVLWNVSDWTHISLVWNKTSNRSDMYFNCTRLIGEKRSEPIHDLAHAVPVSGKLTVGADHMLLHNTPDMMIDEIAIWHKPLSLKELSSMYLAKAGTLV